MDAICGNCAHRKPMADEYMCDCEGSRGYGLSVEDDDACECFEEREE